MAIWVREREAAPLYKADMRGRGRGEKIVYPFPHLIVMND